MKNGAITITERDKTLEVMTLNNVITIAIEDPDYGDSYIGWGALICMNITEEQAKELYQFLKGVLEL